MPEHLAPQLIIDGTLYTLVVFSVITWTLIFFKVWQFAHNKRCNQEFEAAFWALSDLSQLKNLSPELAKGSAARLAYVGNQWLEEKQVASKNQLKVIRRNCLNK